MGFYGPISPSLQPFVLFLRLSHSLAPPIAPLAHWLPLSLLALQPTPFLARSSLFPPHSIAPSLALSDSPAPSLPRISGSLTLPVCFLPHASCPTFSFSHSLACFRALLLSRARPLVFAHAPSCATSRTLSGARSLTLSSSHTHSFMPFPCSLALRPLSHARPVSCVETEMMPIPV